jgi:hypothetical protein
MNPPIGRPGDEVDGSKHVLGERRLRPGLRQAERPDDRLQQVLPDQVLAGVRPDRAPQFLGARLARQVGGDVAPDAAAAFPGSIRWWRP